MSFNNSSSSEDKIFMKVLNLKVDDIQNWTPPSTPCQQHYEVVGAERSGVGAERSGVGAEKSGVGAERSGVAPVAPKPGMSCQGMVGRRSQKGYLVSVNDELIALFRVQGKVYAVNDSCPHAGGPLSMGDIEDLPGEGLCVRCPWHQWAILLDTGRIGEHKGRTHRATVYPVKVTGEGDIYIGFDQVSQNFFDIEKHPSVDDWR